MKGVERQGDLASCETHTNTGSTTVFANSKGITKVMVDSAGGLILGPGTQSVFVENAKVSLPGDVIAAHPPCGSPGGDLHCAAFTGSPSEDVFFGTGFAGDPGGGDAPKTDLILQGIADGGPYYGNVYGSYKSGGFTWTGCYWYVGDITFTYTITNNSSEPTGAFNIGLWEVPYTSNGITYAFPRNSYGVLDGTYPIFRGEKRIGIIPAGGTITGNLVLLSDPQGRGPTSNSPKCDLVYSFGTAYTRSFTMYADLDNEITETDELNSLPTMGVVMEYKANC